MAEKLTNRTVENLPIRDKPYEANDPEIKGFLVRVQPSGLKTFYYSYYNETGKRQRYKIGRAGSVSAIQARDIAMKLAGRVADSEDVQSHRKEVKATVERQKAKTLRVFLEGRYEPWATAHRKSGEGNIRAIKSQFDFLLDRPLDEINNWVIEKWRTQRKAAHKKPATINRELACLKSLLSKAVEWGIIDLNPLGKMKPLKLDNNVVVRYLSQDDEKRLRAAIVQRETDMRAKRARYNEWLKSRSLEPVADYEHGGYVDHVAPMVLLSINTGLRRGEVFNLRWEDISFGKSLVTVRGENAKSGKTRHVPLNDEAFMVLKKWKTKLDQTGFVFPADSGDKLTDVKKSWATLMDLAGLKKFRWHDMRHHFASRLVMAGVDLNTVRELLGHSTLEMTLRYAHLAPEHKAEAVSRLVSYAHV